MEAVIHSHMSQIGSSCQLCVMTRDGRDRREPFQIEPTYDVDKAGFGVRPSSVRLSTLFSRVFRQVSSPPLLGVGQRKFVGWFLWM